MDLYLVRHGEAEAAGVGGDEARELTDKGMRDSRAVAEAVARAGAKLEAIWTSPLVRARQTAEIIGRVLGVTAHSDERLRPGATLGGVQDLLGDRADPQVMLVGHEPDMSALVYQLTGGRVKMRTSGVARIDAERIEPGAAVLVWLVSAEVVG
jgi:phosphohistidine phosphatase